MPLKRPGGPSFRRIVRTAWKTPLYFFTASSLDCSSPCNCNLRNVLLISSRPGLRRLLPKETYRILTVSKLWVTVTAPHAAMPPAMNALKARQAVSMDCYPFQKRYRIPCRSGHHSPRPLTSRESVSTSQLLSRREGPILQSSERPDFSCP